MLSVESEELLTCPWCPERCADGHTRRDLLMTRRGTAKETRGTAYVVYDDIYDAKTACDHLSGFNVANRYLIVLYYRPASMNKKVRMHAGRGCERGANVGVSPGSHSPSSYTLWVLA
jgi:hypothetical protein